MIWIAILAFGDELLTSGKKKMSDIIPNLTCVIFRSHYYPDLNKYGMDIMLYCEGRQCKEKCWDNISYYSSLGKYKDDTKLFENATSITYIERKEVTCFSRVNKQIKKKWEFDEFVPNLIYGINSGQAFTIRLNYDFSKFWETIIDDIWSFRTIGTLSINLQTRLLILHLKSLH